tara:strand:- start:219 stop:773 length:555 start_codon:yes stop_codon:yes gene_type:complete
MTLLTENPWPLIAGLVVVTVGLLMVWNARRDGRLLVAALACVVLAAGSWELARRIVTERERLAATVLTLRDAVQDKDMASVYSHFSESEPQLKLLATTGLALVTFEDRIRITAQDTTLETGGSRGETRFRANVSLKVVGYGSVGRQPTLWSLTWQKEDDAWRVVRVRRFHPLTLKEMSPLTQSN